MKVQSILRNFYVLVSACILIPSTAFSQVYFSQDDEALTLLKEENSSKLSDDELLFSKLSKAFEKRKSADKINAVDSVVIAFQTNSEGKASDISINFGFSQNHREQLAKTISKLDFNNGGRYKLAFVFAPKKRETILYSEITEIPEIGFCDGIAPNNPVFKKACFYSLIESESRNLARPTKNYIAKIEGILACNLIIDNKGKVDEIAFYPESFNPALNDYAIQYFQKLSFPRGVTKDGQPIDFSIGFQDYYYDIKLEKTAEYVSAAEAYFEQDDFYKAVFYFNKAVLAGYQLPVESLKKEGLAYYFVGDTANAKYSWYGTFNPKDTKGKTIQYVVTGKDVELSLKPIRITKPESVNVDDILDFTVVEMEPVFPNCELKTQDCFNICLLDFIHSKYKMPRAALEQGIQGETIVSFVIERDGTVSSVFIVQSSHPILDFEALRVISVLPKMQPALYAGKAVRTQCKIPINVRLQ